MSITSRVDVQLIPMAARESYGGVDPVAFAHGLRVVTGDLTGGTVIAGFTFPLSHFFRLEALTCLTDDAASDVGGDVRIRAQPLWVAQALPVANAFYTQWVTAMAISATESSLFMRDFGPVIDNLRRIPLGVLSGLTPALLDAQWTTNVNGTDYTIEAFFTAWLKPALGLPGFLEAFQGVR